MLSEKGRERERGKRVEISLNFLLSYISADDDVDNDDVPLSPMRIISQTRTDHSLLHDIETHTLKNPADLFFNEFNL